MSTYIRPLLGPPVDNSLPGYENGDTGSAPRPDLGGLIGDGSLDDSSDTTGVELWATGTFDTNPPGRDVWTYHVEAVPLAEGETVTSVVPHLVARKVDHPGRVIVDTADDGILDMTWTEYEAWWPTYEGDYAFLISWRPYTFDEEYLVEDIPLGIWPDLHNTTELVSAVVPSSFEYAEYVTGGLPIDLAWDAGVDIAVQAWNESGLNLIHPVYQLVEAWLVISTEVPDATPDPIDLPEDPEVIVFVVDPDLSADLKALDRQFL